MERIFFILLAILIFGVMIAIHEFGHFITAKLLGIRVNEFAIGMGPALWSRTRGETQYSLRAFPIGGYCAMEGEDEDTGDDRAFSIQPAWKKIIVLCAGSFMHFLMGLVIVLVLFAGVTSARVPVITQLADGFQSQGESGLMVGDEILSVDGHGIWVYEDVLTFLSRNDGTGMDLVVLRDGEKVTRVKLATAQTFDFVRTVWMSLGDLVTGRVGVDQMSGVIGVVDVVSEVGTQSDSILVGIQNVFYIMALIAVNLAVMNMLPIPALDGGRVLFVLLNGISYLLFRRQIPQRLEGYIHAVALVLLLVIMLLIAFQDVWKIVV